MLLTSLVTVALCYAFSWGYSLLQSASIADVADLKVERLSGVNAVQVSGYIFDNRFGVGAINLRAVNEMIDIDVRLKPTSQAPSGTFSFVVYMRPDTKCLRFGTNKKAIWDRHALPP